MFAEDTSEDLSKDSKYYYWIVEYFWISSKSSRMIAFLEEVSEVFTLSVVTLWVFTLKPSSENSSAISFCFATSFAEQKGHPWCLCQAVIYSNSGKKKAHKLLTHKTF